MASTTAPVDVKELSGSFIFVVDVPGLRNTEIKVQIESDTILKISGERRRETTADAAEGMKQAGGEGGVRYVRVERPVGRFTRKFNLPGNVNLDTITAACSEGVLTVVVPKIPAAAPHKPRSFDVVVGAHL